MVEDGRRRFHVGWHGLRSRHKPFVCRNGQRTVWSSDVRNGGRQTAPLDNLYIASILAIDADTGQLKWHYQCTPGDEWDYDAIQHLLLADNRIGNRNRKVIMNLGAARGGGTPMAFPPPHGPARMNPDGSKVGGGVLSAWDPATQKERWFAPGGGQSGGGTLSLGA
jgi:PQQ enzyme repeat